ncbi:MAG TPA: CARDB domain-containing protein [Methanomassiliicoccales archaeon]|nr:CARDB domain-containing protein [Methanomassiliicoccales archaeon]
MAIDQFNTSDFTGAISNAYLIIIYSTQPGFSGTDYIQYGLEGQSLQNTSIGISNSGTPVTAEFNLYEAGVVDIEGISDLNVTLLNTGGADIDVQALWIEVEISPTVYIYRWLNLTAVDSQNLPVGGAVVNATLLPGSVPAYYYTPDGVQDAPPDSILEYLGKNATSFKETGPAGVAYIPLLIEMVSEASLPNSMIIGSYDLNITYINGTGVNFYASGQPTFKVYPAMDEADAEDAVLVELSNLMLDKPDLVVSSIVLDTDPVYDNDDVQISITINNTGLTTATNFPVVLTDFHHDATVEIFNTTIGTLEGGDSVVVVADWSSPEAGSHILTATADPDHLVIEASEDNNELSHQVIVLAQLPDLSITSGGISFTPQPAYTDTEVILRSVISNVNGRASAINASVEFYAGNPDSGGTKIGTASVNVPVGGSNSTQVTWIPSQIGVFPIYVVVNGDRLIEEYSYDNNTAYRDITVDLSIGPQDIVLVDDDTLTLSRTTFNQVGNIIIRDNAELILNEAVLNVVQEFDNQFQVLLEDSGMLTLINSTLTSNHKLRVYLFDDSSIIVDPSEIGNQITLEMNNNSSLVVTDSIVNADIVATPTSNAVITAVNSTFTRAWSGFGGSSVAYLTSINAPALVAKENAVIIHYRWLEVLVLDGTGAPLPGAFVEADFQYNGTFYSYGISNEEGLLLLQSLCDRITSTGFQFYGTYKINATYWYDGERYDSEIDTSVSFDPYSPPIYRDDLEVEIQISSALPELDLPFHVSDLNPARGAVVDLQANVSNIGVVPANSVLVRFKDNDTIIEDVVVTRINPGETAYINITWIADYPLGWHNLSVVVDPYGNIPEINKTNNMNYTWVDVRGIPDIIIEPGDVTINPSSPTTNTSAVITVRVTNDGDISATNVNVSVYDTPPEGPQTLVGYAIIPEIFANATTQTTIIWTPDIPGNHTITVIADEAGLIEEARDDNNQVTVAVQVKNYADLSPVDVQFSPAAQVEVGHMLEIEVDVRNDGESTANNVVVRFWVGDPATGEIIDEVVIPQIMSSETKAAIGVWQANTSYFQKMETRTIFIQVNPDRLIKETNYSNDNTSATINVIDYRPDLLFTEPVRILSDGQVADNASVGDIVNIVTVVKNDGLNSVLGVEIWLYAIDNDSYIVNIARVSVDISAEGTAFINQTWIINATVGYNDIVAWANFDRSIEERRYDNNNISTGFNVTPPQPLIVIDLGGITNYKPDTNVFVRGTITNEISGQPLPGLTVTTSLTDVLGNQIGDASITTTTNTGYFETLVYIPPGLEKGDYMIKVQVVISGAAYFDTQQIYVEQIFEESSIPWWVWLIIIAVVAGVIIGFSMYLYKYGLGKMVECGECGSLIPENSKKCPKCGVEFETGTAKCSECGAWIPASASVCPECGAKFIGEVIGEEEDEYIKKMRDQYDSMLEEERSRAKEELGKKFSEAKFIAWWKKQPNYVSFESWLSEEEEKRKSGAFPCPVCSTLNPRGASICHKCGTIFETKIAEKEEPKKRPLRRIVRRPAGKSKPDQAEDIEGGEAKEFSEGESAESETEELTDAGEDSSGENE